MKKPKFKKAKQAAVTGWIVSEPLWFIREKKRYFKLGIVFKKPFMPCMYQVTIKIKAKETEL